MSQACFGPLRQRLMLRSIRSPGSAVIIEKLLGWCTSHAGTIRLLMDVLKMLASTALALLLLRGLKSHLRPCRDDTAADGCFEDAGLCSPGFNVTQWVHVPLLSHAGTTPLLMDVLKMMTSAALALLLLSGSTSHFRPMHGQYGC